MHLAKQIAKHLREVYFGGNWTTSNIKEQLAGLSWQEATTKIPGFNSIIVLVFHMSYYVTTQLQVLKGGPLDAKDSLSFDPPPIQSQEDWDRFIENIFSDAEAFANSIEALPDAVLAQSFTNEKYGTYYRNLQGNIEHLHYHLGQIALIRKMVGNRVE